jgi:dCMP deaminase
MRVKHLRYWVEQTIALSELSECVRAKFGCLIVDPETNCGGESCLRNIQRIESGKQNDIGCNHAEANAIVNSARLGISIEGKWLFVNGAPCINCAKLITQSGIARVIYLETSDRSNDGIAYLLKNRVSMFPVSLGDESSLRSVLQPVFKEVNIERSPFK